MAVLEAQMFAACCVTVILMKTCVCMSERMCWFVSLLGCVRGYGSSGEAIVESNVIEIKRSPCVIDKRA